MRKISLILAFLCLVASSIFAQTSGMPPAKFNFNVKLDNMEFKFQEIIGLDTDSKASSSKGGTVICKKGIASNSKKQADFLSQTKSNTKHGNLTVELLDDQGKIVMVWIVSNVAFIKAAGVELKGSEIAIESIEFAHEGVSLKK